MLKKLMSLVVVFSILVSVSGRAMAQEQSLSEEDETKIIEEARLILQGEKNRSELSEDEIKVVEEAKLILQRKGVAFEFSEVESATENDASSFAEGDGDCKKSETTWQKAKREVSEIKQWILENKWECIIGIACVGVVTYASMNYQPHPMDTLNLPGLEEQEIEEARRGGRGVLIDLGPNYNHPREVVIRRPPVIPA
ncbi:MAG: hypothetical protein LBS61_05190 [Endomicrobium sp.]|nr:hypothetical protein [Endomicrobium sp.]